MVRHAAVLFALALAALPQVASSQAAAVELPRTPSPAKARLYFISPADGQVVKGVQFRDHRVVGEILELARRYREVDPIDEAAIPGYRP